MSSIKKELKLTASLDDTKLKQQIQELKKELGAGLSLKSADLQGMEKAFERIADKFSQKISKAVAAMKTQESKTGSGNIGGARNDFEKEQDEQWKAIAARIKKEEGARLKMEKKVEEERRQAQNRLDDLKKKNTEEQMRNSMLDRSPVAQAMRAMGASPDAARRGAAGAEGASGKLLANAGRIASLGGGVLAAGHGLTAIRRQMAEREFRFVEDASDGRFLEGMARRSGRSEFAPKALGAAGGAAAGLAGGALLGSALGPVGTLVGGGIGAIGGGIAGAMGMSNAQGELRVEQIRPLHRAFDEARGMSGGRISAMRGGGVGRSGLSLMGQRGAEAEGFSPQETLQHFLQARGSLGNAGARGAMGGMQSMFNATGVDIGTQASGIETLAGAGRTSRGAAQTAQIDTIRKGVAAGLDVSKSGQFLRETSQLLQESTGMGRVDTNAMTSRMAEFSRGFAGGGDITDTNISQARQLSMMTRGESLATSGVSGIGNILGVQDALGAGASPGQLLAGSKLSSNATLEDIQSALGVDEETAKKIQASKQPGAAMGKGISAMGLGEGDPLARFFRASERGQATEEDLGTQAALGGPKLSQQEMDQAKDQLDANSKQLKSTDEFQLAQKEAVLAQQRVVAGFDNFQIGVKAATDASSELAVALKETKGRLLEMLDGMKAVGSN